MWEGKDSRRGEGTEVNAEGRGGLKQPKLFDKASRNHIILYLPGIIRNIHAHTLKEIKPLGLTGFPRGPQTNKNPIDKGKMHRLDYQSGFRLPPEC